MAGLPHFKNSLVGRNLFEPLYLNQFTVIITPPASINNNAITPLLVEHVKEITGLPEQAGTGKLQEQRYRFSKRYFAAGVPADTGAKLVVSFEVNLNDANEMYIYNQFRAWANLVYDPLTGRQGLKKDYAPNGANIYVGVHNRAGDIYRTVTLEDCFITSALGFTTELNYESADPATLEVIWRSDAFKEVLA